MSKRMALLNVGVTCQAESNEGKKYFQGLRFQLRFLFIFFSFKSVRFIEVKFISSKLHLLKVFSPNFENLNSCLTTTTLRYSISITTELFSTASLQSSFYSYPWLLENPGLFSNPIILPFLVCHMNAFIYVYFISSFLFLASCVCPAPHSPKQLLSYYCFLGCFQIQSYKLSNAVFHFKIVWVL